MERLSDSERSELWDLWEAGESHRSIARALSRAPATIRTRLLASGWKRPRSLFRKRLDHFKFADVNDRKRLHASILKPSLRLHVLLDCRHRHRIHRVATDVDAYWEVAATHWCRHSRQRHLLDEHRSNGRIQLVCLLVDELVSVVCKGSNISLHA